MSQQQEQQVQTEKKRKATVQFTSTGGGKLDKGKLDKDEHTLSDHYLFGDGSNKSDYSYPVVSADKTLKKGNVSSAHSVGARGGVSKEDLYRKLRKLNDEFENPPLDDEDLEIESAHEFERSVEFVEKDESEQIAYGAVLVPDELDHQFDFFRGEIIRDLGENYEERFENGDVYGGVMHSVFPDDVELAESRVLEDGESLGDENYPEDTWIQGYKFNDDELWNLVESGVLGGYSIGGTAKGVWYERGTLPDDVRIPDAVQAELPDDFDRDDVMGREITEGRILEVSSVDFPAVPRATHEEYKSAGLQKGHPALTGSVVEARLYLEGRGHDPDDAKALAEYLQSEKSREPSGWLERAKRFFTPESGVSGGDNAPPNDRTPDTDASNDDESAESDRIEDIIESMTMDADELEQTLKSIQNTQEDVAERIDALEADEEPEADEEKGEETEETEEKGDEEPDRVDELAEQVGTLAEATKETNELVERMAEANGVSQQADVDGPDGRTKNTGDSLDSLAELMG